MRIIEHITDVDALPESVWGVLTDVAAYPDWNPFMRMERAPDRVGDRMSVTLRAGKRTMTMKPTVTAFEPGRSICWFGHCRADRVGGRSRDATLSSIHPPRRQHQVP